MLTVGNGVHYYGVDHRPSYLWKSATWEDSEALIPFLRPVLDGPIARDADQTIQRAIEIWDRVIRNPAISWRSRTARRSIRTRRNVVGRGAILMSGPTIGPEEIREAVERQVRAGLDLVDATRV